MNYRNKSILLFLLILFLFSAINAQKEDKALVPPPPLSAEEMDGAIICGDEILLINVSVWNEKTGYVKDLSIEDFKLYVNGKKRKIEYLKPIISPEETDVNSQKQPQYSIGISMDSGELGEGKFTTIKVDLSESKKKEVGKIQIVLNIPKLGEQ